MVGVLEKEAIGPKDIFVEGDQQKKNSQ